MLVDLTERIRAKHVEVRTKHPAGSDNDPRGVWVSICSDCGTLWPCHTIRFLNMRRGRG